jgi:hypothetical protein
MTKLTLSMDPAVVSRAKRYAQRHGISVSRMVEAYLASVSDPPTPEEVPPILRSVIGILKDADPQDYKRHLETKYR